MDELLKDLHFAWRMIQKSPGFTTIAVLTLGLGIGANTAIFSFVNGVLLRPLPYSKPESIVVLWEKAPKGERQGISTLNFLDWKSQNNAFSAIAAATSGSATLTGADLPVELHGSRVSANYFEIFDTNPILGRTFAPDEDQAGKDQVVILNHRVWVERFGARPNIIGSTIGLDNRSYTVIGVLSSRWDAAWEDFWTPLAFKPADMTRNFHWMIAYGRLKSQVTLEQAQAQMQSVAAHIERDYPDSNKGWGVAIERYQDAFVGNDLRRSLYVLLAAVGAVLLIGCANLASLLLARGAWREREIAIRSALGASRPRLIRQFLIENGVLALSGGILGVLLGYGLMCALKALIPPSILPVEADIRLDLRVLLFAAAVALLTELLFGLVPAFHGAPESTSESLKEGGRSASPGAAKKRAQDAFVIAEVALAFVLLSGATLLIRSFYQLQQVSLGVEPTNVITMMLPMTSEQYPDEPGLASYLGQIMTSVAAVPGVRNAALASGLPLEGWGYGMPFHIEDQPGADPSLRPSCGFKVISPSYFDALGMRILEGRELSETDMPADLPVAVINETMAKQYFGGQDPVGKRIFIQRIGARHQLGPEVAWEVVGVVANEKTGKLDGSNSALKAGLYVSYKQTPMLGTALVVRAAMEPNLLAKSIERAVWQVNRNQPLTDIRTLDQIKSDSLGENRLRTALLAGFAAVALLLAAIGIYGVISHSVAQRTQEMGLRAALGATQWDQLRLVLGGGMVLTAVGIAIGLLGALALTHLLASLLFGVGPYDPATLLIVGLVLSTVAACASYIPARRATRVHPVVALRHE